MFKAVICKKMIKWQTQLREICLLGCFAFFSNVACASEGIHRPSDAELEDLAGESLPHSLQSVKWQADEPPKTNLFIYAVQPKAYQPKDFKLLATFLGLKSEPQKLPPEIIYQPGFWIKEANPTNKEIRASLVFSEISGMIRFGSGEDNHRWDLKNHKPLVEGVPNEKDVLQRTLALLPLLGITTNDLEHLPDGRLKYACNTEGTWCNDRHDNGARKRYTRQINIEFWQKIHAGATVLSIGGAGMLRVGYISDGRLAEIEMTFRNLTPVGKALPKTSAELIQILKRGQGRSFYGYIPDSITITNCGLVYPAANATKRQDFLWPFYSMSVVSVENGETNSFQIYEPLEQ